MGKTAPVTSSAEEQSTPPRGDEMLSAPVWQAVLDSARDAIICIDGESRIRLFNPAAERMFGYERNSVLGREVEILMPSPYAEEHATYVGNYRKTGIPKAIGRVREVEARRKDGTVFPIELSVSEAISGQHAIYTAIIRDVTERREMETALRSQRDFADRLIDMAHAIVLVLDPQGRIVHFNAHMEEISGYRLSEVEGSNWFDTFLPAADHPRVRGVFARAMSEGEIHGNINPIVTKQGAMRQIEWYAKTLNSHDGEMIGVISVGHDITERLADQAKVRELEHESRQRGRLADIGAITAKVVHDLGNPLAAVSMQAQLILRRAKRGDFQPAEAVEKPVAQILSTLRRLETLVREFTDFAREQRLQLSDVRLPDLLGGIIELWRDYASGRGVEIHAELIDEPAEIRADEEMLRRVLDNIVKNALDAVESMERSSGTIVIRTSQSTQDRVTISVADDGPGIPHDFDAFRLFETSKPSGTGIGLAVAQQIVFAHNGTIDFASNSPQGTVFRIHLPIAGPGENEIDTSPV